MWRWTISFHEKAGILCAAEWLLASTDELGSLFHLATPNNRNQEQINTTNYLKQQYKETHDQLQHTVDVP